MKVKLNPMFEELRGQLGDVVFRELRGRTIASRKPGNSANASEAQTAHRERFKQAAAYGRSALADPATRELYEEIARNRNIPVFAATISDFFNAPVIDEVEISAYNGQVGDLIQIIARDGYGLASVHVSITEDGGAPIESGDAVSGAGGWTYTASQTVPAGTTVNIRVVATDRPGGTMVTTLTKSL